jgi:hypothetical protein
MMHASAANKKGLGYAINNDDFRSSMWLRIKDFQRHDPSGRHRFGRPCDDGFTSRGPSRNEQRAPATTQAR